VAHFGCGVKETGRICQLTAKRVPGFRVHGGSSVFGRSDDEMGPIRVRWMRATSRAPWILDHSPGCRLSAR